ncbi:MAG: ATP-binding protein [Treponema sp.]|nr:ATP-binding protein [Treponema sp.]
MTACFPFLNPKSRTYFEKDFFTDSDLNIRYRTKKLDFAGKPLVAECAIDIANDSAAKMLSALPFLALVSLAPILLLSFTLSLLISRSTIKAFKVTHPECTIRISDPDFLEIETDEQKLHQIFTVILSNSVKFAGEKCEINLAARKNGSKIELSASDNGPGFTEELLNHVFERFYKGDSSHDRNVSGAGLGLSIAKALAIALGGDIKAKNAPAGGALILLTI